MTPEMNLFLTAIRTYEAARKADQGMRSKPLSPSVDELGDNVDRAFDALLHSRGVEPVTPDVE